MIFTNPKVLLAGGLLLVILSLTTWGLWERSGKLSIKAELTSQQAEYDRTVKENKRIKEENDERIKTAATERESLMRQLRDNQLRFGSLRASITTRRPKGTCTESATVDAALSQFLADTEGFITEGDEAIINVKAWADSWPK